MLVRRFVAIFAVLLVLILAQLSQLNAAPGGPIIPARRIGPFSIGQKITDAVTIMRRDFGPVADKSDQDGQGYCNTSLGIGVCVYDWTFNSKVVKTPGRVAFILTDDPRFDFMGSKAGDDGAAVVARLGDPDLTTQGNMGALILFWYKRGIGIAVYPDGTIDLIGVFIPAK